MVTDRLLLPGMFELLQLSKDNSVCFLGTTDLLRPTLPPQTTVFPRFFLTQRHPTFQTTPFCLLKNMCASATEFGYAGPFFGGPRLPRQAGSARLSFGHVGR